MCLAVPGRIVSSVTDPHLGFRLGKVDFGGIVKEVCLDYLPEANTGDYVLVHVGFALSIIDEEEARKTLQALAEFGALEELSESHKPDNETKAISLSGKGQPALDS